MRKKKMKKEKKMKKKKKMMLKKKEKKIVMTKMKKMKKMKIGEVHLRGELLEEEIKVFCHYETSPSYSSKVTKVNLILF
ncbi:hypothetical protein P5V15_010187 [Pogonomyrmex californicus]